MYILLAVVAIILVVLAIAAMKPSDFRFEHSIGIDAPPEKIFPLINDFHQWPRWSPWENVDPAMQRTYSGAPSGVGARYEWKGNSKAGEGAMDITSSTPAREVVVSLHFIKPFEARNMVSFTIAPSGDATNVTWAMYGKSPFMVKVMKVFVNMDKMLGKDFDRGLASMKAAAES